MMIVSFSGIDGAGKSTQISEFEEWLRQCGVRTLLLTFWDDVVVMPRIREFVSHRIFRGDKGIGSPQKPIHRRDKNVTSLPVSAMRFFLYSADAVNLSLRVRKARRMNADVLIFDRYIYDELANLPFSRGLSRAFTWLILKLAPKPDIAYVIDADPAMAFSRKPEYPLEFLHRNREAYLALSRLAGGITVIEAGPVEAIANSIRNEMLLKAPRPEPAPALS
jgi:thymidylate kinase